MSGTLWTPARLFASMTRNIPKEVLVVEDEAITRIVAADAIADTGVMVWEAADAGEALELLEEHPRIGLLFTDVDMPGKMDGIELAHRVSRERPDVGLIVTSGAVQVPDGALPDDGTFIAKPYQLDRLAGLVTEKLDGCNA